MTENRGANNGNHILNLNLTESSHELISKIQPVVTQVLRSPREKRTNKYSTYHDEEHAETKHTHTGIHSTVRMTTRQ